MCLYLPKTNLQFLSSYGKFTISNEQELIKIDGGVARTLPLLNTLIKTSLKITKNIYYNLKKILFKFT